MKPTSQIVRSSRNYYILSLSLFITNSDYHIGDFIYLYPEKNDNCDKAIKKYKQTLVETKETFFKPLTLEEIVSVIKETENSDWINDFENRYLKFEKIDNASRQQSI